MTTSILGVPIVLFLIFGAVYYFLGRDTDVKKKGVKKSTAINSIMTTNPVYLRQSGKKPNRIHRTRARPTSTAKPIKSTTVEWIWRVATTEVTRSQYINSTTPNYAISPGRILPGR